MSALGFDFLIEHAYPHANDLILHFQRMAWVRQDMGALISKGCCHLLSQSLKWTMCLQYPPTFRARLATYLSLLVNHVRPPQSCEWTEVLQFKDPGQLERATEQWLETLDNDTGESGTKITGERVAHALGRQRDDAQQSKRMASALDRPSVATNKILDGRRPSMPPPPPKVPLSHSRGATGGGLTCGKVPTKDGRAHCMGQQRASYSSKPPTHASTSKRKRMEAGAGTANDTAEKQPRPRPPLPRGVPPNTARPSSSPTRSKSGPPATTNQPKACTPRPPSTPMPRPPNTPKPRPLNTSKPRPPNTPEPRPSSTPRPPSMPKPLRRSTPLPPNTPKPKKSFTPSPPNAPKLPVTLAARPPSTHKPRPPTTPTPRQPSTPNLLKKPAATPKPLQTSTPLPVTTTMSLESLTPRPPCTPNLLKKPAPRPPTTPQPL
ncbi:unnamed protein product [Ectocarpus sp. 13 AM-2016]